jgi:SNF2 family DNA or RNA helicase
MKLTIEYLDEGLGGKLTASEDFSAAAWNRIREVILGVQADALCTHGEILVDWSALLAAAAAIGDLRARFGFAVEYNEPARHFLTRYRDDRLRLRQTVLQTQVHENDVASRLAALGFTRRQLTREQTRDLIRLAGLANGANFSVPGAGKTTVTLALHLLTRHEDTRLLIVAPKTALPAWDEVVDDCFDPQVAPEWAPKRLAGGYDSVRASIATPARIMIITYDQLLRVQDVIARLLSTHPIHMILDESHRVKAGDRTQRGASVLRLAHLPQRRDILSGTPLPQSIEDIKPQIEFLWPGQGLGERAATASSPQQVLAGLYVRTTKHELGLPPPIRHFLPVAMQPGQLALYTLIREEVLKRLSGLRTGGNVDLLTAKRSVMRLLQASSNPLLLVRSLTQGDPDAFPYSDEKVAAIFRTIVAEGDSAKIRTACGIARRLAANNQRCVIWSGFVDTVERIAALLDDLGATYIHGGVDSGEVSDPSTREGRLHRFHEDGGSCRVLVANPAACAEGISLHRVCHNAIYVDRSFNAAHYLQSVDRIHRLGLDPAVQTNIHVLESVTPQFVGSVDFSVRRRMIDKLRVMGRALEDTDLQRLALDEEEANEPLDYDITLDDMRDVIDELTGEAATPLEE